MEIENVNHHPRKRERTRPHTTQRERTRIASPRGLPAPRRRMQQLLVVAVVLHGHDGVAIALAVAELCHQRLVALLGVAGRSELLHRLVEDAEGAGFAARGLRFAVFLLRFAAAGVDCGRLHCVWQFTIFLLLLNLPLRQSHKNKKKTFEILIS